MQKAVTSVPSFTNVVPEAAPLTSVVSDATPRLLEAIRTAAEPSGNSPLVARSGSYVEARNDFRQSRQLITAQSGARVFAQGNTHVIAESGSAVTVERRATVEAKAGSTIHAGYQTTVLAEAGSDVRAAWGSTVIAKSGSRISVWVGSSVKCEPGAEVSYDSKLAKLWHSILVSVLG